MSTFKSYVTGIALNCWLLFKISYTNYIILILLPYIKIAKNRKKYREKKGISQDKLFKLDCIILHTIKKIEYRAMLDPRIETVKK